MSDRIPTAPHGLEQLLTTEELARYLGVAVQTIHLWRTQKTAPPGTRMGKGLVFPKSGVDQWLKDRIAKDAQQG
jgi:excisionase family DNA binding protein